MNKINSELNCSKTTQISQNFRFALKPKTMQLQCNNYLSTFKYEIINFNVDFKRIANVASGNAQIAVVKEQKKEMKLNFINLICLFFSSWINWSSYDYVNLNGDLKFLTEENNVDFEVRLMKKRKNRIF